MKIYDKSSTEIADVIITKEATHEEEIMKSDFVRLSWSDAEYYSLPVGAFILFNGIQYSLLEPYSPEQKNEAEWKYEPQFHHPKMYLSKCIFERPSVDTSGNDITYIDWPYTGTISTLMRYFVDSIKKNLNLVGDNAFGFEFIDYADKVVSVNFSSNDILSALTNVANVCECEWHIDWESKMLYFGNISYGTPSLLTVGDNVQIPSRRDSKDGYWNAFMPQGSTRNIMRKSASEEFVQSDVRLSLDRSTYPDGIIYTDGNGNVLTKAQFLERGEKAFIKPLIFDEIYPKTDLYIYKVRYRERYRLDDDGKKVVAYTDDNGVEHYLRYTVWYFRLAMKVGNQWKDYELEGPAIKAKVTQVLGNDNYKLDIPYNSKYFGYDINTFATSIRIGKTLYEATLKEETGTDNVDYKSEHAVLYSEYHTFAVNDELLIVGNLPSEVYTYQESDDRFRIPKENIITDTSIIDGKKPIIAFQPNTETGALDTPLAGLGNGDGDGHYGFTIRYLKNEQRNDSSYVRVANKAPKAGDGDTGIVDMNGVRSSVDINDYEVEFEEDGTTILPSTKDQGIYPKGNNTPSILNNKVNIYNVVISENAEDAAKIELETKTLEYIQKSLTDNDSRTLKSNPISFESSNPNLFVGQKIILDDGIDLGNPSRVDADHRENTRVMKLVTKLDFDFEQEITIGNQILKGNQTQTKENVEAIINGNMTIGSMPSESYIQQIVKNFTTPRFLSKQADDTAEGNITFNQNVDVKGNSKVGGDEEVSGNLGVGGWIKAALGFFKTLRSENYTGNAMNDTGYELTADDGNGNSRLVVDNIVARMKFIANILEVRKLTTMGGNYVFSPAASVIEEVDYFGNGTKYVIVNANIRISEYDYRTSPIHLKAGDTITITDAASQYHSIMTADGSTYLASDTYTATEDINVVISSAERGEYEYELTGTVLLGYEYIKSPWLLKGVPMFLQRTFNSVGELLNISGIFSTRRLIRSKMSVSDWNNVTFFRCWLKADDGSTKTINTWRTGMLARCQTFDASQIEGGTQQGDYKEGSPTSWAGKSVTNKLYWRAVGTTGQGLTKGTYNEDTKVLDDGKAHNYIDLSNVSGMFLAGSDRPSAGDNIVCYGDYLHEETSNIITIETVGEDAPSIKEYVGVGYSNGSTIDWNNALVSKMKTRISPVAGNRFVAPEFLIEITEPGGTKSYVNLKVALDGIESNVSTLDKTVRPKNLIPSEGWTDVYGDLLAVEDFDPEEQKLSTGGEDIIYSPLIFLPKGSYVFSCYTDNANMELYVYHSENNEPCADGLSSYVYSLTAGTGTYESKQRRYAAFTLSADAYVILNLYDSDNAFIVYRPQLEAGTTPTEWVSGTITKTSQIKQSADEINLNIRSGLSQTGININTHKIVAKTNNFEIQNTSGTKTFGVDQNGNLVSLGDAAFGGTVRAQNFFHNVCFFCEGDSSSYTRNYYTYFKYYCYNNTGITGFEVGKYYDESEIPSAYITADIYFKKCTYDADVISMIPNSSNWSDASGDTNHFYKTVILPNPEDFEGKVIEVMWTYKGSGASGNNPQVGCVITDAFAKTLKFQDGYIQREQGQEETVDILTQDETTRYVSVKTGSPSSPVYCWLKLK